jgi:diacylglycerol kinase family enzyme
MAGQTILVGNPTARSGRAEERIERALAAMKDRGWDVRFMPTQPEGRTPDVVRDAIDAGGVARVVYMGGDGTFAETAKGVLAAESLVPMGMLPSGTANDQGKSFGVSSDEGSLEKNLDTVAAGHLTQLDVGRIERLDGDAVTRSDLFFDSAGFGLQAEILRKRNEDKELVEKIPLVRDIYRDQAVYAGALVDKYLKSFVEPPKFRLEVSADGRSYSYDGLIDVIIKATPVYGGAWILDRQTEPDDGLFELVPIAGRRDWFSKALRDLKDVPIWQEHLDELGIKHTEGFSGTTFELTFLRSGRPNVAAQIDGEEFPRGNRFRVYVDEQRLPLITPAGWTPPWRLPT